MSGSNVNKQQMLSLLNNLANDDGFRSRFEVNPESALAEVGIPKDQISGFTSADKAPGKLASKADFAAAHKRMTDQASDECFCMIGPHLRLAPDAK